MTRASLTAVFHEGWKYFLVSAVSLGLDVAVYWCLYRLFGVYYLAANVVSVSVGLIANYAMSVRFVFAAHRLKSRNAEFAGFVAIGLAGLLVNEAGVAVFVGLAGLSRVLGKLAAAGLSFVFNFAARRLLLFSAP
ncbi:MAG TPA: GtrA family protein [Caulobacteraceae bacterium]|nr:GtrA family protein [Caulobacteraceae bacterium]